MNAGGKCLLGQTVLQTMLRRNARYQAGRRIRQVVRCGLAQNVDGLTDFVETGIGADSSKLRRPVCRRVDAKGFVIVPKKCLFHLFIISLRQMDDSRSANVQAALAVRRAAQHLQTDQPIRDDAPNPPDADNGHISPRGTRNYGKDRFGSRQPPLQYSRGWAGADDTLFTSRRRACSNGSV